MALRQGPKYASYHKDILQPIFLRIALIFEHRITMKGNQKPEKSNSLGVFMSV